MKGIEAVKIFSCSLLPFLDLSHHNVTSQLTGGWEF